MLARDDPAPQSAHYPLGPALGQCCGGAVTLGFSRLDARSLGAWPKRAPRFHLQLYGAGHVGRAIVQALAPLNVLVDWIDEREDEFPAGVHAARAHPQGLRRHDRGRGPQRSARRVLPRSDPPARPRPAHFRSDPQARRLRLLRLDRLQDQAPPLHPPLRAARHRARGDRAHDLPDRRARHRRQGAGGHRCSGGRPAAAGVEHALPGGGPAHGSTNPRTAADVDRVSFADDEEIARQPSQRPLVRPRRLPLLRPPLALHADGLRPGRLEGQAGHRDRQHLERRQPVPHALQAACRGRQARRAAGRRLSARAAGDQPVGADRQADDDAVPQLPRDGDRGAAALAPDRRRGADGRLRQDHAGPADGRVQRRSAVHLPAGRADAARQLEGPGAGLRIGQLQVLGRAACRPPLGGGVAGDGGRHRPQPRHLHDDGHGRHDDGHRGGDRHDLARRIGDPGPRCQSSAHERGLRPAHRRDGLGGSVTREAADACALRERHRGRDGDGLLDQRDHSPRRDVAPCRTPDRAGRLRRREPPGAGDREHPPERRALPDGGLLLRRRPDRADEAHRAVTCTATR